MTLYRAAQSAAAKTVERVFAEPFTLQPMAHVAGRWSVDATRSAVSGLLATLTEKSALLDQIGERGASGMSKGVASQSATANTTIEFRIADVGYQAVVGDRFIRASTGEIYQVSAAPPTDLVTQVVRVAKVGGGVS